jgi:hypothetical protein
MDKIYLKDNYIVTELGGVTAVFPKNYSSYSENASGFYINSTFPVNNQRAVYIDFTRVASIYNEAGTTAYTTATLRSFFLTNTGFKSPSGGSGGVWGGITGTLSSQTDLQSALDAKQNTLTLTTTGTSGAATLVGDTLNIPQYSGGGGSSNFSIISLSATNSAAVTGTTANSIVSAILIPANTFSSTGIIDIAARYFKTGTLGSQTVRMYVNTSASLTGATLVANFYSGSNRQVGAWRTANIASNTINFLSISGTFSSDLASINAVGTSATFNTSVDNYIIFTVQLTSTSDSCVLQFHKILRYV